jgi:hypothetical protein
MKRIEIRAIRFSFLNRETHYEYLIVFDNLLKKYPVVMALIEHLLDEYHRLLELEANIVDSSKKSLLTERIKAEDNRIDRIVVSINAAITSALHHFNPEIVNAAKILRERMKNFGTIIAKAYEGESAIIQLLLRDLQGYLAPQVNTVGITDRVAELADAEALFTQLFAERNAQIASRLQMTLKEIHTLIEPLYRNIIATINAYITINTDTVCVEFINELNEQIKYFIDHSKHPKARIDVKGAIVNSIPDQVYTGKSITFIPVVEYEDVALVFGNDFTVSFKNNINIGNATLIIHGIGKYKDIKTITFNIIKN